jgi:hypothetical protein
MITSTGCFESGKLYEEGEKLPSDVKRPCEMCYCIKGFRKCVMKKCAPLLRGCIPKVPKEGNCCPTSYDCSRSLKITRQVRQDTFDDEPEEDSDSIDFFSLLFGSDEPPEEENTLKDNVIESTTTVQPFKALPTTEKSFFDFIRAGLEIIDANADKIDSSINDIVTTPQAKLNDEILQEATTVKSSQSSTEKFIETTVQQHRQTFATQSNHRAEVASTTMQLPSKVLTSSTESTTLSTSTTVKTPPSTTTRREIPTIKKNSVTSGWFIKFMQQRAQLIRVDQISLVKLVAQNFFSHKLICQKNKLSSQRKKLFLSHFLRMQTASTTVKQTISTTTSSSSPSTRTKPTMTPTRKIEPSSVTQTTQKVLPPSTTQRTTMTTKKLLETTPKVLIETPKTTTISPSTTTKRTTLKFMSTTTEGHQGGLGVIFNAVIRPDSTKIIDSDDNEAETLPNIEIIPFVAHDAIDTEKFDPYSKPYDNLEKDYFANDKEKPFRYNNKFIHHGGYDDSADYVYTNPHERIDNGPFYFETNENQFDTFLPPSEQDFLGEAKKLFLLYDFFVAWRWPDFFQFEQNFFS